MAEAVIVDSVRTGLSKSFRGGFNQTRADDMTAHIIDALMDRNPSVDPETVEDLICLLYTSPSPRDQRGSRMPSSA